MKKYLILLSFILNLHLANGQCTASITASGTNIDCPGGSAKLSANEGTGSWSGASTATWGPLAYTAGFSIGGKGYLCTGLSQPTPSSSVATTDLWQYDPATQAWSQKAAFAGNARYATVSFTIGDSAYVGCGLDRTTTYKDMYAYSATANTWSRIADLPGGARSQACGLSMGGKGYVGMGVLQFYGAYLDFYEYDPATGGWRARADYGGGLVYGAAAVGVNGQGYVCGGNNGGNAVKGLWRYSPSSDSWANLAPFGGAGRYGAAQFMAGGKWYVGLGGGDNGLLYSDFYEYDFIANSWAKKADAPGFPRFFTGCFSAGSKGYVCGGVHLPTGPSDRNPSLNTVYSFSGLYDYQWSSGATTAAIMASSTANYTVTVTNSSGCAATSPASPVFVNTQQMAFDKDMASAVVSGAQSTALVAPSMSCSNIATILPNGNRAVSGMVNAKVFVDESVQLYPYLGQQVPALQRHYDITPQTNAATATAQLTLYYSQGEFDAYNDKVDDPDKSLPTSASDVYGRGRLRILQYHGSSADGSGSPASYSGAATLIAPDEDKIVWNNGLQRWEVTFDITGFSGFFLGVDPLVILPVKLVSFTGQFISDKNAASLQWQVAEQQGIQKYIVERGTDGNVFQSVGSVAANQLASSAYTYTDRLSPAYSLLPLYYRLKLLDSDGTISYSNIIKLSQQLAAAGKITQHPNPLAKGGTLQISVGNGTLRQYKLLSAAGQVLLQKDGLRVTGTTSLQLPVWLAAGVYYLQLHTNSGVGNQRIIVN